MNELLGTVRIAAEKHIPSVVTRMTLEWLGREIGGGWCLAVWWENGSCFVTDPVAQPADAVAAMMDKFKRPVQVTA